jgi:hypothetical protein
MRSRTQGKSISALQQHKKHMHYVIKLTIVQAVLAAYLSQSLSKGDLSRLL